MEQKWYFAEENNPSNNFSDEFSDSKFSIDKWNSFVREIIQNSLDVNISDDLPVRVNFDSSEIPFDKIPGARELKEIFSLCLEQKLNRQTELAYKKAIEILSQDKITCLKISDFNTKGVKTDVNADWGYLVYDTGISSKSRPGSAGSHGVGKKAPFLVSSLNCVFYNTYFGENNTKYFEGKTNLVNFVKDGKTYSPKGWFGNINVDAADRREKIVPIKDYSEIEEFDNFFYGRNSSGTDVIIVGAYLDRGSDEIKNKIINAVFENFFVGIKERKLEVKVFDVEITSENIDSLVEQYYTNDQTNKNKIDEYENVRNGNLKNYLNAFNKQPEKIDVKCNGKNYGYLEIYFELSNSKNKKTYCFFRDHGMKIQDMKIECDQPYSAVVIARDHKNSNLSEGDRLNSILASRENAAHDTFITDDERIPCDSVTKAVINEVYKIISDYILAKTEIKATSDTPIYSLTDMMSLDGVLSTANVKKVAKLNKKKKKIKKKVKVSPSDEFGEAAGYKGDSHGEGGGHKGPHKPAVLGGEDDGVLYEKFKFDPSFCHFGNCYELRVQPLDNISSYIKISSYSVDGSLINIPFMLEKVCCDGEEIKVKNNTIGPVSLKKDGINRIKIHLKEGLDYNLECVIEMVKYND